MILRTVVTEPAEEPVTRAEAKAYAQIGHTDLDDQFDIAISAARQRIERETNRAMVDTVFDQLFPAWPGDDMLYLLPHPVSVVGSIKYIDSDGVQQTLSTDVYDVQLGAQPVAVHLKYQQVWPTIRGDRYPVTIRYTAGYGAAATVPGALKAAVMILTEHLVMNPDCSDLPAAVAAIVASYRVEPIT